jgi:hypothetical protein
VIDNNKNMHIDWLKNIKNEGTGSKRYNNFLNLESLISEKRLNTIVCLCSYEVHFGS